MNGTVRRRGLMTKIDNEWPHIGKWEYGVRANTTATNIVNDTNWCMTPYYKVQGGHQIKFYENNKTITDVSVITEMPENFTNISERVDIWRLNSTSGRTITLSTRTHYIIGSIPIEDLDYSYILDITDNVYIYKGKKIE